MLIFKTGGQKSLTHIHSISVFFPFASLCLNCALPSIWLQLYFFFHFQSFALISFSYCSPFLPLTTSIFPVSTSSWYVFVLHLPASLCSEAAWSLHSQHGIYMEVQEHSSCQTISCSTWASTAWVIRMGKEIDRESERNWWQSVGIVSPVYNNISLPSWPDWAFHLDMALHKLHIPCYFFFPPLYFLVQFPPIETH